MPTFSIGGFILLVVDLICLFVVCSVCMYSVVCLYAFWIRAQLLVCISGAMDKGIENRH